MEWKIHLAGGNAMGPVLRHVFNTLECYATHLTQDTLSAFVCYGSCVFGKDMMYPRHVLGTSFMKDVSWAET